MALLSVVLSIENHVLYIKFSLVHLYIIVLAVNLVPQYEHYLYFSLYRSGTGGRFSS